jgi:hypothetical protein
MDDVAFINGPERIESPGFLLAGDGEIYALCDQYRPEPVGVNVNQRSTAELALMALRPADPAGADLEFRLDIIDHPGYTLFTLVGHDSLDFCLDIGGDRALYWPSGGIYPARITETGWCQLREGERGDLFVGEPAYLEGIKRLGLALPAPKLLALGPRLRLSPLAGRSAR